MLDITVTSKGIEKLLSKLNPHKAAGPDHIRSMLDITVTYIQAFDKVSHEKLALKQHDYGIRGPALKWVKGLLDNPPVCRIVNGFSSEHILVSSGVPQRSVLGPLHFLIYINDLHMNVKSKMRLFADDATLYLTISTSSQSEILKKDIDNLKHWSHKWDMEFNPSKCQVIP